MSVPGTSGRRGRAHDIALRWPLRVLWFAVLFGLSWPAAAARWALVFGNDSYQQIDRLQNARADADAMGTALRRAGYDVTVRKDRTLRQMKDDLREWRLQVRGGDEVVLYFSMHGVQIGAMNYLLPVDVRSASESQVRDDSIALSAILEDLREQRAGFTLVIVDACRDNPFRGQGRNIGGRGLTGVAGANGQMVIYAAGEGQQALDRLNDQDRIRNGLFTRILLREMARPGVPVTDVMRNVRREVARQARDVGHDQVPAIYDQVLGDYYFHPRTSGQAAEPSGDPGPRAKSADEIEDELWRSMEASTDRADFDAYLREYPRGRYAARARIQITRLERRNPGAAPVPAPSPAPATAAAASSPPASTPPVTVALAPSVLPTPSPSPSAAPALSGAVPGDALLTGAFRVKLPAGNWVVEPQNATLIDYSTNIRFVAPSLSRRTAKVLTARAILREDRGALAVIAIATPENATAIAEARAWINEPCPRGNTVYSKNFSNDFYVPDCLVVRWVDRDQFPSRLRGASDDLAGNRFAEITVARYAQISFVDVTVLVSDRILGNDQQATAWAHALRDALLPLAEAGVLEGAFPAFPGAAGSSARTPAPGSTR